MVIEEHAMRVKIISESQHPLKHNPDSIFFSDPSMPGVNTMGGALRWLVAVLYPQALDSVATPGDLPAMGNQINDYRVVTDDGDGKAAGYRWFAKDGSAAAWHKVYDMDWGVDSVLSGFFAKTQDIYVARLGYDELDENGDPITGVYAGQSIYGGITPDSHLTLYANNGDGLDPSTGFVQFGDNVRPIADDAFDLGTTDERWGSVWVHVAEIGDLHLESGLITDLNQLISFDTCDLETDGYMTAAVFRGGNGDATTPTYSFEGDSNSGWYLNGVGEINLSLAGVDIALFTGDGLTLPPGDASNPALRFSGAAGLFGDGDEICITTDGTERVRVNSLGDVDVGGFFYFDVVGGGYLGIGLADPETHLHIFSDGDPAGLIMETESDTDGPIVEMRRARDGNANLQALDVIGEFDYRGRANAVTSFMAYQNVIYRGNSTTRFADFSWGTANGGSPLEKMRLRYDGNLGLGITDPTHKLHIAGDAQIDNLNLSVNTISTTNVNGNLLLAPNGSGQVGFSSSIYAVTDGAPDLGGTANRFNALYLDNLIGDGTNSITMATLLSFRQALIGAASGMSLFYNGSVWLASAPDTEIDHGTVSGLGDDDHTQYALLAGRGTSQTLKGGTGAGDDLYLESTAHATKGNIFFTGDLAPTTPDLYDVGGSGAAFRNLYLSGEAIGLRVENYSTAGRPAATVGTAGRLYYDTTDTALNFNKAGTWRRMPEKVEVVDTTSFDGIVNTVNIDVTGLCTDARKMIWCVRKNADDYLQEGCEIRSVSATNVRIFAGIPLAAGTYTIIGVG